MARIIPGRKDDVVWSAGNWIILDIGFANKRKSCGIALGDEEPRGSTFSGACREINNEIQNSNAIVNLVIEAPLSVCFDRGGNPKGRKCEIEGDRTRYWYVGPGAAVMVASLYLVRGIWLTDSRFPVRIFEGFVSFSKRVAASDGKLDVKTLRSVIRRYEADRERSGGCIFDEEEMRESSDDRLISAFDVAGMNCGVPIVIKAPKPR